MKMRYLRWMILIGILNLLVVKSYAEEKNVDSCLMILPLEQRYKGENLDRFIRGIEGIEAQSFIALLENWQDLSFTTEEQKKLLEKIEGNINLALLSYCSQEEDEDQQISFSDITPYLIAGKVPVCPVFFYNLNFIKLWTGRDVDGVLAEVDRMIRGGLMAQSIYDWLVLGKVLEFVLDHSDKEHCQKAIKILDNALNQKTDQDLFVLKKVRDNFEGKMMLIEMGEE